MASESRPLDDFPAAPDDFPAEAATAQADSILLPYQTAFIIDPAAVKVCEKSRRIGISFACAFAAVRHAGVRGRGNFLYQSYNHDMTRGFIGTCAEWARSINAGMASKNVSLFRDPDTDRDILVYRIKFANGHSIEAMTNSPKAFRSKGEPGDIGMIDEAAFVDDLDEVLKAALAFTIWGGSIWVVSTPNGADNPFNDLLDDIRAGRKPYSEHRLTLDDAIADGLAEKICEVRGIEPGPSERAAFRARTISIYGAGETDENVQEELFCIPKRTGVSVYSRQLLENVMVDAPVVVFESSAEFETAPEPVRAREMTAWLDDNIKPLLDALDPGERHHYGMDFARHRHASVFVPVAVTGTLKRNVPFILEMVRVPHAQQLQAATYILDRLPKFCGGASDASGNGEALAEALGDRYGSCIIQQKISEQWWGEWTTKWKAGMEDGLVSLPRSDIVIEDHRLIRRAANGIPKPPPASGKTGRHCDSVPAMMLMWQSTQGDSGPIEGQLAGLTATASALSGPGQRVDDGHWTDNMEDF